MTRWIPYLVASVAVFANLHAAPHTLDEQAARSHHRVDTSASPELQAIANAIRNVENTIITSSRFRAEPRSRRAIAVTDHIAIGGILVAIDERSAMTPRLDLSRVMTEPASTIIAESVKNVVKSNASQSSDIEPVVSTGYVPVRLSSTPTENHARKIQ